LPLLPLAAGLAATDAIRSVSGLTVDLRWPNDLLIGPRKTGGILAESTIGSKSLPHAVVVGIGINVHQRTFPRDLATPATSLDLESSRHIVRQDLLLALLKSLQQEAHALANPDAAKRVIARVEKVSTWMRGRRVEVHGPQACRGVTAGLDENGFLRVTTAEGLVTVQTGGLREKPASSY
jgi:BirA family biotin operon repressor/biotin-[acetyl-CoA-carboxylase] ligase